jgi:opacity protein-like surface antigen
MFRHITRTAAAALLAAGPTFAGGFAAPVAVAAPAAPAVVPVTPVIAATTDWSGAYVGGQLGFGRLTFDDQAGEADIEDETFDGALYGLHAGYMFDFGRIVAGGEIDFDGTQIDVTEAGEDMAEVGSIARAKLRLGYDAGRVLPYVTAGLARVTLTATTRPSTRGSRTATRATSSAWVPPKR